MGYFDLSQYGPRLPEFDDEEDQQPNQPPAPVNTQGIIGDTVDAFQAGAWSAAGGIADFVGAERMAQSLYGRAQANYDEMSQSGREAMGKKIIEQDEQGGWGLGDGATDFDTWLLGFANMAGQFAATAIPGAGAAGAVSRAAGWAGKGKAAANITGLAATGGSAATGQAMDQARQEYLQIPLDVKAQSDIFKTALQQVETSNPQLTEQDKIRAADALVAQQIADEVRADPKVLLANFGASAIGDPVIGRALTGIRIAKGGIARSGAKGFAIEGSTEAAQAGASELGVNQAVARVDNRDPWQGVAEAAANEGILGGAFGGAIGAAGGFANRQPNKPAPTDPATEAVRQSNPALAAELDVLNTAQQNRAEQVQQVMANADLQPAQAAPMPEAPAVPQQSFVEQRRAELEQALQQMDTTKPDAAKQVADINKQLSMLESDRSFASVMSLTASKPYRDAVKAGLPIEIVPAKYRHKGNNGKWLEKDGFKWQQKPVTTQPAAALDAAAPQQSGSVIEPGNAPVVNADPSMVLPAEVEQLLSQTPTTPEVTANVAEENAAVGATGAQRESNLPDRSGEANGVPARDPGLQPQLPQPAAEPVANSAENTSVADAGALPTNPLASEQAPNISQATDTNVGTTLSDQAAVMPSPETDTAPSNAQEAQARTAPEPVAEVEATPVQDDAAPIDNAEPAADLAGEAIDPEWTAFADDTGTKKIPRAEMPQIKAEHRGAMVQFMKGRDITHEQDTVPAVDLKPTQAEFSPAKVKKAMDFEGGNRSILVSSDGYVLDGHHQWLAAREKGEQVDVIRLNAPIEELIPLAKEFPSSTVADGATEEAAPSPTNQAQEQPSATVSLPEILRTSKSAYIKKQVKSQKLRESSPGYAQALSKLDEQYDTDYDRALAGLTFEQFNEVNKGVPESLNRQAYAQLREDFGLSSDIKFSKTNNSKDGVVKFDGTEIDKGAFSDAVDRIKQAARYAFSGKVVKNKSDNTEILIPWSGIKKSLSGQVSESALLAATKLDQVIENGIPVSVVEDRKGRNNIKAIHNYQTTIEVAGKPVEIQVIVRETLDGKRYYDHFEIRKNEGPAPEELARQDSIQEVSEATSVSIEQAKSDIKFAAANTTGTKPAKGVPVSVAQREADRFVERLSGAAGIKVQVLPTQQDAEKLWRMSLDGDFVRGAYSDKTGTVYIIAENARNMTDLRQTIAHELFAHGGLDKVIGADKKQEFLNRLKGTRGKKEFKGLWSQIDRDYDGMSEDVKAEELFAYFVQNQPQRGPVKFWWNAFKRWLNNILANLGITSKGDPDVDLMQSMMESIMFGFQFGRKADSNAEGGLAFSMEEDSEKMAPASVNTDANTALPADFVALLGDAINTANEQSPEPLTVKELKEIIEDRFNDAVDFDGLEMDMSFAQALKQAEADGVITFTPTIAGTKRGKANDARKERDREQNERAAAMNALPAELRSELSSLAQELAYLNGELESVNADSELSQFEKAKLKRELQADIDSAQSRYNEARAEAEQLTGIRFSKTKGEPDNNDASLGERIASVIKPRDRFTKSRVPEYEALNAKLRETDKTLTSKIKRELGRWILPGGNMPEVVKQAVRGRDRDVAVHEFDVSMLVGKLDAAMKANGLNADRLTDDQWQKYHSFLTGQSDGSSIAESERLPLLAMREQIDGLTRDYVASVTDKLQRRLEQEGTTDPAELARLEKMMGNIGKYLNRSYKAFDDKKWFSKIPTEVIDNARDYLRNQYQQGGATPEEARAKSEITLNEMVKTGTAYDSLGAFIAESKLGSKDLSVLIPRKDIAPEIRALLGEYIDPRINYAKSVAKMSSMIANDKLLTTIRDMGLGAFIFEKDSRPPEATVQLAGEQSAVYAPLNGLWTTPEIKQAFEDAMGDKAGEGWLELAIRFNSFIKYGKTVLSPTTAMRNIMSSYFFTVANGHFNQKYMRQAISAFNAQVKGSVTDGESAYIKRLIKLGVIYDSANAGEMVRAMTDGRVKEMLDGKTGAAFEGLRWLTNKATGFYRFGDDFWKIVGFENEKAALVKTGMSEAEAEVMAAERIQDTYPTYSRVGKAGVWLSRFPLMGTFVSFPAEIIRTTGNMVRLAISEMKSDNPKIRAMGARRVVGMSLVSGGIFALSALTRAMFGVSDDEEEALRDLAPEWQKNSTFVYAGRDSKGNLRYFDMTFLDPYGYWKRPIEAFMRNQSVDKALASSLKDMLQPFFGVDITAGKLLEVVSNQKESGGQVFKENDSAMRQAADISKHLALGLAPGAVNNAWRIGMAAADQKRATGQPYSLEDEMLALLGFRSSTFDPKTGLYYRTFDFNSSMAEARQELSGTLRDPNTVSDSDIKAAWERARKKQEKAFKEMTRLAKAAQTGGASRAEVAQILRLAGISQRNTAYLLAGKVPPVNLSDRSYESAVRRAQLIMDADAAREVRERYRRIMVTGVQQ